MIEQLVDPLGTLAAAQGNFRELAEGEAVPREDVDKMTDLALRGIADLVALQKRVIEGAGVELAKLLVSAG